MHKTTALLLTCLLQRIACYKATVLIGEVTQRDTNRPVYQIHLPHVGGYETTFNPPDGQIPAGLTSMRMVTARGQALRCLLPEPEPEPEPEPSASEKQTRKNTHFTDMDALLKEYSNKCFVRWEGWWTYEFCYGQHVVQKHIIPTNRQHPLDGEIEDMFVLGRYNRTDDHQRRKNTTLVSTPDAPFTQMFDNGTVCDKTGNPRRVLVKYVCCEDIVQLGNAAAADAVTADVEATHGNHNNFLKSVREVESCVYEVEFMNAAICRHPAYKEKLKRSARRIHCSLMEGEGSFKGLKADHVRRASLSL